MKDLNPLPTHELHDLIWPHQRHDRRPHILIDVDDVLADFYTPYWKVIVNTLGKKYPALREGWSVDTGSRWDLLDGLRDTGAIDEKSHALGVKAVKAAMASKGFAAKLKPRSGAIDAFSRLQALGTVTVVTSPYPSPYWIGEREAWLKKWFNLDLSRVIHARDKTMIDGDVLIDDKARTVLDWVNTRAHRVTGIIKDVRSSHDPRRRLIPNRSCIYREATWDKVVEHCRRISEYYRGAP